MTDCQLFPLHLCFWRIIPGTGPLMHRFRNTSKRHFPVQGALRRRSLEMFRKRIKRAFLFRLPSGLVDVMAPAVGVLQFAELYASDPLVELSTNRSYDTVGDEAI